MTDETTPLGTTWMDPDTGLVYRLSGFGDTRRDLPTYTVMDFSENLHLAFALPNRAERIFTPLKHAAGAGVCGWCGASRAACDARLLTYPKRCCPICKDNGPARTHTGRGSR